MFENWTAPKWEAPWEPEKELEYLKKAAYAIATSNKDIGLKLDAEIIGCLFVEIRRENILIGTFTVSALIDDPLYSFYMGSENDEIHIKNLDLAAEIPKFYKTEYQPE